MGVKLQSALGGSVELNAPSTASNFTMTVPAGNGTVATTDQLANFRNRIINGDMRIDQWNNGGAISSNTSPFYILDRWSHSANGTGVVSGQRVADAPAGFTHSLKLTVTTADTSVTGTDYYAVRTSIEGYNCSDFGLGTSNSVPFTLSFWVKASNTGTYSARVINAGAGSRVYSGMYTINAANTWEYKTLSIPANTVGTWAIDNAAGIELTFQYAVGTSYGGAAPNQWNNVTSYANSVANLSNTMMSNVGATWQITGVQLERGSIATDFERRPYTNELQLCQRYYQKAKARQFWGVFESGSTIQATTIFPVEMRATPSVTKLANSTWGSNQGSHTNSTNYTFFGPSTRACCIAVPTNATTVTVGIPATCATDDFIEFTAEL